MSRTPLAPDLWEQALINGRTVHPGSDEEAFAFAQKWYVEQGGVFAFSKQPVTEVPLIEKPEAPEPETVKPKAPAVKPGPEPEKPAHRKQVHHGKQPPKPQGEAEG